MVHSDDKGLVLPPRIAPKKVVIIPIGDENTINNLCEKINKVAKENNGIYNDFCDAI